MSATDRFIECVNRPESQILVEEVAMLIAAHAHSSLDVESQLSAIGAIAEAVLPGDSDSLRQVLFVDLGLHGNTHEYYNPENSYLDAVLRTRRGIPITLSVLTMAIGRRAGIDVRGVALPGHFLVQLADHHNSFLDPFDSGRQLDSEGCGDMFRQMHGRGARFSPSMLEPVGPIAIAERMLNNLLASFRSAHNHRSQLWVTRLRAYLPRATLAVRADVAIALANAGRFDEAAHVFDALALESHGEAADEMLAARDQLRARLN